MKKISSLVCAILCAYSSFATCVTAKQVSTNYMDTTVTFTLTWSGCTASNHLTTAWCFVDFRELGSNSWTRAIISGTPTVSAGGIYSEGHEKGFYVKGTEGQSATVTVKLGNVSVDKFDWCAFATDYPPQVSSKGMGNVTFKGTPPFYITYVMDNPATATTKDYNFTDVLKSFTDATGCPGTIPPFRPSWTTDSGGCDCAGASSYSTFATFAPAADEPVGTLVCLTDDRNTAMRQYRVKKMHDGRWWMVQNLAYGGTGNGTACNKTSLRSTATQSAANTNLFGTNTYGDCRLPGNNTDVVACYGYLYNWAAVMQSGLAYQGSNTNIAQCNNLTCKTNWKGICPADWHVPSMAEFIELDVAMGGSGDFDAFSSTSLPYWFGGVGMYSWEVQAAGYGSPTDLSSTGTRGRYYTQTFRSAVSAMHLHMSSSVLSFGSLTWGKEGGLSLRCVKN